MRRPIPFVPLCYGEGLRPANAMLQLHKPSESSHARSLSESAPEKRTSKGPGNSFSNSQGYGRLPLLLGWPRRITYGVTSGYTPHWQWLSDVFWTALQIRCIHKWLFLSFQLVRAVENPNVLSLVPVYSQGPKSIPARFRTGIGMSEGCN